MDEILSIHNRIFDYLMKIHESEDNFYFMPRRVNNKHRLEKGYWFIGDDKYLQVTFWDNDDPARHIHNIAFTINYDKGCYLEFSSKYDEQKAQFLETLTAQLGSFENIAQNRWRKYYEQINYIELLNNFIRNEKLIIDNAIRELKPAGIDFIKPGEFEKYVNKILGYKEVNESKKYLSNNFNIFYDGPALDAYTLAHLNYTMHVIANKIAIIDSFRNYDAPFFKNIPNRNFWNSDIDIVRLEIKDINSKHSIEEEIVITAITLLSSQWGQAILQNLSANIIWAIGKSGLKMVKSKNSIDKDHSDGQIDPYEIGPNLANAIEKISKNSNGKPWKLKYKHYLPNGEKIDVLIDSNIEK